MNKLQKKNVVFVIEIKRHEVSNHSTIAMF